MSREEFLRERAERVNDKGANISITKAEKSLTDKIEKSMTTKKATVARS